MLQIAMFFIGAAGLVMLFQILVLKQHVLKQNLRNKKSEKSQKTMEIIFSLILVCVGILGIFLPNILGF
jgi:hypothetical protein